MAVKRIFSAGGIVLRKGTKGTKGIKVLVTQHSKYKGWDFPKGHIEIGEDSESAALREVEEETGVKAKIIDKVGQTQYFYWETEGEPHFAPQSGGLGGEKVLKTVTFYLMKYIGEGEATTAFEVSAKKWLAPDEVEGQLTFKDTKELWRKAKEKIENG